MNGFEDELEGENKVTLSNQPPTLTLNKKAGESPALDKIKP